MSMFLEGGPAILFGVVPLMSCSGMAGASTTTTSAATTTKSSLSRYTAVASTSSAASAPATTAAATVSSSVSLQHLQHELHQRLQSSLSSPANPQQGEEDEKAQRLRRRQMARVEAGRSKSGIWGPTHSADSEDSSSASASSASLMKSIKLAAMNGGQPLAASVRVSSTTTATTNSSPRTHPPPSQRERRYSSNSSPATVTGVSVDAATTRRIFRSTGSNTKTASTKTTRTTATPTSGESPTKSSDPNPQGSTSSSTTSSSSSPISTRHSTTSTPTTREPPPTTTTNANHTATTTASSTSFATDQQQQQQQHLEKSIWERATCTMLSTTPKYYNFWNKSKQQHQEQESQQQQQRQLRDESTIGTTTTMDGGGTQNTAFSYRFPDATASALQRHADMLADFMEDACGKHQRTRSLELMAPTSTLDETATQTTKTKETRDTPAARVNDHGDEQLIEDDDDEDDTSMVHEEVEVDLNSPIVISSLPSSQNNVLTPSAVAMSPAEIEKLQQQQQLQELHARELQRQMEETSLRLVAEVTRSVSEFPDVSRTTSAAITDTSNGINGPTTTGTLDPPTLPRMSSVITTETPMSRRRFRYQQKQSSPPKQSTTPKALVQQQQQQQQQQQPQQQQQQQQQQHLRNELSPTRPATVSPTSTAAALKSPHHHSMPPLPPHAPTSAVAVTSAASHHRAFEGGMLPPEHPAATTRAGAPLATLPLELLTVKVEDAKELERSISELTMRSSYAEATSKLSEQRRMAYYAVGRHHRNSGRGGNRRCYFSGKLILGGAPFYAGSVQQGLRTLVVFCLPSAIGLPLGVDLRRQESISSYASRTSGLPSSNSLTTTTQSSGAILTPQLQQQQQQQQHQHHPQQQQPPQHPLNRELAIGVVAQPRNTNVPVNHSSSSGSDRQHLVETHGRPGLLEREQRSSLRTSRSKRTYSGGSVGSRGHSKISSLDDMSLSIEEDLDPNWGLDRDYLLQILPEPSQELLDEMAKRYPEQFETLPVQVRSPHCWRLFVKFCFFSGLPIAEGEMHYKVRDEIAQEAYGEEIILSHEVMEAVNGESAEILRLPNQKTFRYLRKHYTQQSGKLPDVVFRRQSWILVRPEV